MATKRKRRKKAPRRNECKALTDLSKVRVRPPPQPFVGPEARDLARFRAFVERDWLAAFGAWLFADPSLPTGI